MLHWNLEPWCCCCIAYYAVHVADTAAIGRCHLKPCPEDFRCEEDEADHRYDCTQGNVRVPTWVRKDRFKYLYLLFIQQ